MAPVRLRGQLYRRAAAGVAALGCGLLLAACAGGTADQAAARHPAGDVVSVWDMWVQLDEGSPWGKQVARCAADAGTTLRHKRFDKAELTAKATLAVQQGDAPDVLIIDNTEVALLARTGALSANEVTGADVSGIGPNILGAGQLDGRTYGVPIGSNTLALFYNAKVLAAAGVDPASVRDWPSLNAALARVKAAGKRGITFSAIATEEGSFQFLPWFWGAGADLRTLDSPQAVAALQLWSSWVRDGYAEGSVVNATQDSSWKEFLDGDVAFAENGTWQRGSAKASGLSWGVIPIPARAGGPAPAPLGGEFVTMPVQKDGKRYAAGRRMVSCLTRGDNALATDTALAYVAATPALQQRQVAADPDLAVWVTAVSAAKGRTSGGLGAAYPRASQLLSGAVQTATSGATGAAAALHAAQAARTTP